MRRSTIITCCVALLAWGCGGGSDGGEGGSGGGKGKDGNCLKLTQKGGVQTIPPAGVRVVFSVQECNGDPVPDLLDHVDSITVINNETGKELGSEGGESAAKGHASDFQLYTILLLDLSDSIVEHERLPDVIEGAKTFVTEMVKNEADAKRKHSVAVFVFGSTAYSKMWHGFTKDHKVYLSDDSPYRLDALSDHVEAVQKEIEEQYGNPCDECGLGSTNLYGAYVTGIEELKAVGNGEMLTRSLVVMTDGEHETGDPEGNRAKAIAALAASSVEAYSIGIKGDYNELAIKELASHPDNFVLAEDSSELVEAFQAIGDRLEAWSLSNYVVGICSPVEEIATSLTIQAQKGELEGTLEVPYDTAGFVLVGCNPAYVADPCEGIECGTAEGLSCGTCDTCGTECIEGSCTFTACEGKPCGDDGCEGTCPNTCEGPQDVCVENACVCQPDCEDAECGDDGCEGICGVCTGDQDECMQGQCVCQPSCVGKECGASGCGGSCGACDELETCLDGQCPCTWQKCASGCCQEGQVCFAETCCTPDCEGNKCGDDGCGGSCGDCTGSQDACVDGACVCQPDCDGKVCGDDGCGGSCGECTGPQEQCVEGQCICQPACEGKECGDDGCEGDCGLCGCGQKCQSDLCVVVVCDGKECGDDGCGGSCGTCPGSQAVCLDGLCVCQPDCVGKACGDDGCGGSCGECDVCHECLAGGCTFPDHSELSWSSYGNIGGFVITTTDSASFNAATPHWTVSMLGGVGTSVIATNDSLTIYATNYDVETSLISTGEQSADLALVGGGFFRFSGEYVARESADVYVGLTDTEASINLHTESGNQGTGWHSFNDWIIFVDGATGLASFSKDGGASYQGLIDVNALTSWHFFARGKAKNGGDDGYFRLTDFEVAACSP